MDRLAINVIAKPMRALVDLFQPLLVPQTDSDRWHTYHQEKLVFTQGLAGLMYEMTYQFRLDEPDPPLDQYEQDFQKDVYDLLNKATPQGDGYVFDHDGLHTFIETIVTDVLKKLCAERYKTYSTEELGLLIEVTIALIEERVEKFSYCYTNGANPAYPNTATVPVREAAPGTRFGW